MKGDEMTELQLQTRRNGHSELECGERSGGGRAARACPCLVGVSVRLMARAMRLGGVSESDGAVAVRRAPARAACTQLRRVRARVIEKDSNGAEA